MRPHLIQTDPPGLLVRIPPLLPQREEVEVAVADGDLVQRRSAVLVCGADERAEGDFRREVALGDLLDELERFLVEVASGPEHLSTERLDEWQKQIDTKGLLFRVRVVSSEIRERQKVALRRRTGQTT